MRTRAHRLIPFIAVLEGIALLIGLGAVQRADAGPAPVRVLPAPPATVTVSQRSSMVIIGWTPVAGAAGYAVEYDTSAGFASATRVTTDDSVAIIPSLPRETAYHVRVAARAAGSGELGAWGPTTDFVTVEREYPMSPPALTLAAHTSTSITATWPSAGPTASYQVAIGKTPDVRTDIKQVKKPTSTFDSLAATTTYYVSVRALDPSGDSLTAWSAPKALKTPASLPLRVGSFNIRNGTISAGGGNWTKRRHAVADTVAGQDVSVLGLQEATWNIRGYPAGQYADLARLLGKSWKSTTYVGNAGPEGTRIIYDSNEVTMLRQGYQKLAGSHDNNNWRYVTWAEFRQLSTGKKFFFANTHFLAKQNKHDTASRKSGAQQLVKIIERYNTANLPTIIVGDFNSHKFRKPRNTPYDIITDAGYIDPLDNVDGWRGGPRGIAEKRINANLFTINLFKRKAMKGNYSTGVMLDQIFVTPMRVTEWETVARLDSSGRFIGTIPSDHNMIRATVLLP